MSFKELLQKLWDYIRNKESNKPTPEPTEPVNEDLDISTIKWLGSNYSGATMVKLINSASMNNKNINTSYNSYNWPTTVVGTVTCDAICCLFYEEFKADGTVSIVGGKFDWFRKGGQASKTLVNVHDGYQGHVFPEAKAKVWTMIVSIDGKQRSNICSVKR